MTPDPSKATARPWMAASVYSSVVGIPIGNQKGQRVANTALPDLPKSWDTSRNLADAALICEAVNAHDSHKALIAELCEALDKIEYASRKDSLTDRERLSSVRTIVCAAISKAQATLSARGEA